MTQPDDIVTPIRSFIHLPESFWTARPVLAHVRAYAHHRAISADAVLAFVLARVAAATPPSVQLPPIIGGPGSLNYAALIIGDAGAGKSSAKRAAADLVDLDGDAVLDDMPLGSGEGLVEAYFGMVDEEGPDGKTRPVKRVIRRGVFAYLDEGQALAELGGRRGSTLLPTLRSAWTGDTLGQANATEERRRHLPAHGYRLSVVIGYQPEHAAALLADAAGGTPQRFLWLSAEDPNIPYEPQPAPPALAWAAPPVRGMHGTTVPTIISIPADIGERIRHDSIARRRGELEIDPLDAHGDLGRLKVAALLALLEERVTVVEEDWSLAGTVMATSRAVRSQVAHRARAAEAATERSGHARALRRELSVTEGVAAAATDRMARAIARHVHRGHGDDPCIRRCCTQATRGSDRRDASIDDALASAIAEGWIVAAGDTFGPGDTRPA